MSTIQNLTPSERVHLQSMIDSGIPREQAEAIIGKARDLDAQRKAEETALEAARIVLRERHMHREEYSNMAHLADSIVSNGVELVDYYLTESQERPGYSEAGKPLPKNRDAFVLESFKLGRFTVTLSFDGK